MASTTGKRDEMVNVKTRTNIIMTPIAFAILGSILLVYVQGCDLAITTLFSCITVAPPRSNNCMFALIVLTVISGIVFQVCGSIFTAVAIRLFGVILSPLAPIGQQRIVMDLIIDGIICMLLVFVGGIIQGVIRLVRRLLTGVGVGLPIFRGGSTSLFRILRICGPRLL